MSKMIFVNLPVTNRAAFMAFYTAIGFKNNPHFTGDTAACMVWSETINVMLLTHAKWRSFTSRPIPPSTSGEVLLAISPGSRDALAGKLSNATPDTVTLNQDRQRRLCRTIRTAKKARL